MADAGAIRKPSVGTLTRADLADIVHREIGLSRAEFGGHRRAHSPSYVPARWPTARMSRSPASAASSCATRASGSAAIRRPGVEVPIAPRRVLTFRASQIMRERIARELSEP